MKSFSSFINDPTIEETLNVQQRMARSRTMKRLSKRISRARVKSLKKRASMDKLKGRANKHARNIMRDKILGKKGLSWNDLSLKQKEVIDKKLEKLQSKINKMSTKLLPKVRNIEKERMQKLKDTTDNGK